MLARPSRNLRLICSATALEAVTTLELATGDTKGGGDDRARLGSGGGSSTGGGGEGDGDGGGSGALARVGTGVDGLGGLGADGGVFTSGGGLAAAAAVAVVKTIVALDGMAAAGGGIRPRTEARPGIPYKLDRPLLSLGKVTPP